LDFIEKELTDNITNLSRIVPLQLR